MERTADNRLATYGTLGPGRANHHLLIGLQDEWRSGVVNGRLVEEGWGAALGFPGLILDPSAPGVEVLLFESDDLPARWPILDAFEGEGYQRVVAQVVTPDGVCDASIYVLAKEPAASL